MSNLSNITNIKNILSKYGFSFSKSLGQNFLINPSVCPKMAQACNFSQDSAVIEIGPGIGVLTYELAKRADKVIAIELDKRLLPVLNETLADFNNITLINDDILKLDIKKLIDNYCNDKEVFVCANLPYYITSPVIMKLLESQLNIKSIVVMIQKEAAQRICATPGTRNSGAISIAVNYYAEPELLFYVSKGSFIPSPNVDSAVLKLNIRKNPPIKLKDKDLFFKIVKAAFGKRRKTLINALSSALKLEKVHLEQILEKLNIKKTVRAEELNIQQFADISNIIKDDMNDAK